MSSTTTGDNGSTECESVKQLMSDGFVLLGQLCSSEFVELVPDVSQRRAGALKQALGEREIGIGSAARYVEIVQRSPGRWDVPMVMGPTEFARGSHLLTNHLSNSCLVLDELIYQHAKTSPELLVKGTQCRVPENCANSITAGSCLVYDDRILHRGLANRSGDTRHVAYFSYRRRGYFANTHFESQRSVFDATT